jgi:hypothetical protein
MDTNALLDLWKDDEIPACDEGMILAKEYLVSCGNAVQWGAWTNQLPYAPSSTSDIADISPIARNVTNAKKLDVQE